MKLSLENPENEIVEPGVVHVHLRFRPANFAGILIAALLHVVLLYWVLHLQVIKKKGEDAGSPMYLVLNQDKSVQVKREAPKKSESKPVRVPRSQRAITPPMALSDIPPPITPPVPPAPIVQAAPEMDMLAMVSAARDRRHAKAQAEAEENPGPRGMSPQEVAEANVRHSLRQAAGRDGTNGVFQILSKSTRMGSFSFRGWRPNSNSSWKQVIEVDAGLGGNVEQAIVRRMIELIRNHYQGNFNWESQRLGKVIVLSARPEDADELEAFLMKEFFS